MIRVLWLIPCLVLANCAAPARTQEVEVCRPDGVEPAQLGIGPLEFSPQSFLASVQTSAPSVGYSIAIQLNETGAARVATLTREQLGRPVDLRLDDEVIASPVVHTPILDGRILIAGDFTRFTVTEIVERLAPPCQPDAGESE